MDKAGAAPTVWGITMEQSVALVKYRCSIVRFDGHLDDAMLRSGSVQGCLPIIRFLFTRFSELLSAFLEDHGHSFTDELTNVAFVERLISCWHLVSSQPQLGNMSVEKMTADGQWGVDRLLFTMQCLLVCSQKHCELHELRQKAMPHVGSLMTSSLQISEVYRPLGADNDVEKLESTLQWMLGVYRDQLEILENPVDGKAEQEKWMALLNSESMPPDQEEPLIDHDDRELYRAQLRRAGICITPSDIGSAEAASYAEHMRALYLGNENSLDEDNDFDDSLLNTPFIAASK
ncbi:hypothetical protein AB1Y20_020175 [Prymnesium parvum]|uniref:Uncharacterized protein n=1 Tax=Prymnesium parvum TaxID=97485 RepID=A0AB34JST7_PRYPA